MRSAQEGTDVSIQRKFTTRQLRGSRMISSKISPLVRISLFELILFLAAMLKSTGFLSKLFLTPDHNWDGPHNPEWWNELFIVTAPVAAIIGFLASFRGKPTSRICLLLWGLGIAFILPQLLSDTTGDIGLGLLWLSGIACLISALGVTSRLTLYKLVP